MSKENEPDDLLAVVDAGLNVVGSTVDKIAGDPVLGLAISSALAGTSLLINKAREQKVKAFIDSISADLSQLEQARNLDLSSLLQDQRFLSLINRAIITSIFTYKQEKIEWLRNAILNCAESFTVEDEEESVFITFIDTLTVLHIKMLHFMNNHEDTAREYFVRHHDDSDANLGTVLADVDPRFEQKKDLYRHIMADLYRLGLTSTNVIEQRVNLEISNRSHCTQMGKRFLGFINRVR